MLVECRIVQLLWMTVSEFLIMLNVDLACDPSVTLLNIYTSDLKTIKCKNVFLYVCVEGWRFQLCMIWKSVLQTVYCWWGFLKEWEQQILRKGGSHLFFYVFLCCFDVSFLFFFLHMSKFYFVSKYKTMKQFYK